MMTATITIVIGSFLSCLQFMLLSESAGISTAENKK